MRILLALMICAASAAAQPLNPKGGGSGGGVSSVAATSGGGVVIGGSAGAPSVGLVTNCGTNEILKWSGSAWVCTALGSGGGITNSAASGVVPISNGTNIVSPTVGTQMLLNGPTIQNLTLPGGSYVYGEVNVINLTGAGPIWPADTFAIVVHNAVTYDASTHSQRSGGAAFETTSTKTGGNTLTNVGMECLAQNGDNNICMEALAGDVQIDTGNLVLNGTSANIFQTGASGFIATLGTFYAEGSNTYGIDITGTPTYSINSLSTSSSWNVHNVSASTLTLSNDLGALNVVHAGNTTFTTQASGTGAVHLISNGPSATLTNAACSSTKCTDIAGTITTSSTSATITFAATYNGANDATCVIQPQGTATMPVCSESATAITCATVANATKYNYVCMGHQ